MHERCEARANCITLTKHALRWIEQFSLHSVCHYMSVCALFALQSDFIYSQILNIERNACRAAFAFSTTFCFYITYICHLWIWCTNFVFCLCAWYKLSYICHNRSTQTTKVSRFFLFLFSTSALSLSHTRCWHF